MTIGTSTVRLSRGKVKSYQPWLADPTTARLTRHEADALRAHWKPVREELQRVLREEHGISLDFAATEATLKTTELQSSTGRGSWAKYAFLVSGLGPDVQARYTEKALRERCVRGSRALSRAGLIQKQRLYQERNRLPDGRKKRGTNLVEITPRLMGIIQRAIVLVLSAQQVARNAAKRELLNWARAAVAKVRRQEARRKEKEEIERKKKAVRARWGKDPRVSDEFREWFRGG